MPNVALSSSVLMCVGAIHSLVTLNSGSLTFPMIRNGNGCKL